jgi:hypothetical protein
VHFESDANLHSKYFPGLTPANGYEAVEYKALAALFGQMRGIGRESDS